MKSLKDFFGQKVKNVDSKVLAVKTNVSKELPKVPYDMTEEAGDGFLKVGIGNKYGLIDKNLKLIIPVEYHYLHYVKDILVIQCSNGLWGVLDMENEFLLKPVYTSIEYKDEGPYDKFLIVKEADKQALFSIGDGYLNIKGMDKFGNEFTDSHFANNRIERCTQTERGKNFEFLNDIYNWGMLWGLSIVKVYEDDYHYKIKLYKDSYGRLLLHFYEEEMNFDGPDREDFLWVSVKDEADADNLATVGSFSRLREPYIAASEGTWMSAHEMVNSQMI
jgi:hypothetical protein